MGCWCSKLDITLHIMSETKYKTFPIENTYDIQMTELHIFIDEIGEGKSRGRLSFSPIPCR